MKDGVGLLDIFYALEKEIEKTKGIQNLRKPFIHHFVAKTGVVPCVE
jgi:hypothetical protein